MYQLSAEIKTNGDEKKRVTTWRHINSLHVHSTSTRRLTSSLIYIGNRQESSCSWSSGWRPRLETRRLARRDERRHQAGPTVPAGRGIYRSFSIGRVASGRVGWRESKGEYQISGENSPRNEK